MAMDEPNGNEQSIMSGIENTGGVLHNRKKLRQRFDIIKKLGQGTYGKVQLGINKETGQEVAIKTIKKCKIESSADLIRIRREVQIMSSVRHPNIIHIYEVFENREKMVLVMEYAAGGELYDYLSSRKVLAEEEARRIFRQIATAIYYCHKHKICHRDLKLENILLDENGNAKIADFGLSNVFAEQRTLSTYCGSPLYASPEIVTGTPYNGPEVDCWSLGVLLYTMVYGAMPFDGTHFKTLVKQISLGDYFEPKKKSPASTLIKDMLTVSSKDRADVEKICSHWWVNEGYEHSCLDIAEELASQTPVRLDLLLSLNPQTVDSEKLVVTEEQVAAKEANEAMEVSASTAMLTRSQSADSILDTQMALPPDNEGELGIKPSLTKVITPSVDIVEERANSTKRKLDLMESTDKVAKPSKVKSKPENDTNDTSTVAAVKLKKDDKAGVEKKKIVKKKVAQNENEVSCTKETSEVTNNVEAQNTSATVNNVDLVKQESKDESGGKIKPRIVKKKIVPKSDDTESTENDANLENNIQKPKERRKSRILEAAEKFNSTNNTSQSASGKKIFIPGVSVGEHKQQFERRASLNSATPPATLERKGSLLIDCTPPLTPEVNGTSRPFKKTQSENHASIAPSEKVIEGIEKLMNHLNVENETNEINTAIEQTQNTDTRVSPVQENTDLSISLSLEDARKSLEQSISLINEEKKISDKELNKKMSLNNEKPKDGVSKEQQKKHAVETISNAIPRLCIGRKPPVPYGAYGRSSSMGPSIGTLERLKIQSPMDKFNFGQDQEAAIDKSQSTDMQVSATLPRRKVSTAEIKLRKPEPKSDVGRLSFKSMSPMTFRTEVEHKVGDLRSAPVRPTTDGNRMWGSISQVRATSLEPEKRDNASRERIVPIQVHPEVPRTPSYQRSTSTKSGSLSRQNTGDSDGGDSITSNVTTSTMTAGAEPIRKSPREVIIPIAVEGGGYVTPRATSLEPSEASSRSVSSRTTSRARRLNSVLSDSGDEAGTGTFGRLHRHSSIGRDSDNEDGIFHLHRLRSSRPARGLLEPSDSVSSGEDDDDDGFEILTAENLFSTLLSRVRSLTQRLNVDEDGRPSFPRSSLLSGSPFGHTPFWERDSLSRRLNSGFGAPSWRRSTSRDTEGSFGSPDWSSNNTLPRGRKSKTTYIQDSSKIPIVNNNNYSSNDPANMELNLADLDLSRLKLSQSELDALTSLTPNLSQRQQNQLLSQLPPTQARKLSRHLSLRLPKSSSPLDKEDNAVSSNNKNFNLSSTDPRSTTKSYSSQKNLKTKLESEFQNESIYKKADPSSYVLPNGLANGQVFDKYLPLQKATSLIDSNNDKTRPRRQTSQRRISRFLRPDFFDTPRDESFYAKEKRERELETQQVLREIRVKRDRSLDRSHTNITDNENSFNKDKIIPKYTPKTLCTEPNLLLEKDTKTWLEKSDVPVQHEQKTKAENSKIARPKSLIMTKDEVSISNNNEEINLNIKANSISKLPTRQTKRESKLLRPKSYPNSAFSIRSDNETIKNKDKEDGTENKSAPVNLQDKTVKNNSNNDKKIVVSESQNNKEPINKTEVPTKFLQSLGQTFDKLRNDTKTKMSKKSSKESANSKESKEKTPTNKSALKLLKRKSASNSEKNKMQETETTKSSSKVQSKSVTDEVKTVAGHKSAIVEEKIKKDKNIVEVTNNTQTGDAGVSANTETKAERKSRIENVIKSLRERSIPRGPFGYTESGLIKRAVSVEDVTGHLKPSRRSVSKVLDLFNKLESESNDTIRKKDDSPAANVKLKNKFKATEVSDRPKSLVISNKSKTETGSVNSRESIDRFNENEIDSTDVSKPSNQSCDNNNDAKSIKICNNKKAATLKLDFSKINNVRKSVENSCNEINNKASGPSSSHLTNNCDYINHNIKDLDPSDISSATTCLSPNFEPELAFDDWSICSDSVIHKNHPMSSTYSDVSPNFDSRSEMDHRLEYPRPSSRTSYSNYSGLENSDSESIIDRIKRKSYYSRFNEKKHKRKSSIVGPGAKDYYSTSPVFDNKLDRTKSKPTSPLCNIPDNVATLHRYRPKKSLDLSQSISSEYESSSPHIKRRESCSAFDYSRLNSISSGNHSRNYFTLDSRSPKVYGRSYSNYADNRHSINQNDGIYGNYLTGMHSAKDILYNRDYHLSKDYIEPKSPYSRKSYMSGCNAHYHTYNPSMSYSNSESNRSHSRSSNSVQDHSDYVRNLSVSPQLKEEK